MEPWMIGGISGVIAVAVAWGIIRAEVSAMKEANAEHKKDMDGLREKMVTKEHCRDAHVRSDKSFDEFKADLKGINKKLDELLMRSQA